MHTHNVNYAIKLLGAFVFLMFCRVPAAQSPHEALAGLCDKLLESMPAEVREGTIAILPFADSTAGNAGAAVAEYLITLLRERGARGLVDRAAFHRVIEEIEFSQLDLADQEKTLRMGRMLAARYILTGSIADLFGSRRVSARIIDVETTELVAAAGVNVAPAALDKLTKELLGERAQVSAVIFRSLLVPGWGQFYTGRPVQGALFSVSALASGGVLVWSLVDWNSASNTVAANRTKLLSGDPDEDARLRAAAVDENSAARRRTAVIGGITGGVWALNLLNAAILGSREKKRVRELYFSCASKEMTVVLSLEL